MKILIADRTRSDFDEVCLSIRQFVTQEVDRHFAKWVVSPDHGRFIVFSFDSGLDLEMGELIQFATDEADLIALIESRIAAYTVTDLDMFVAPELDQRLNDRFSNPGPRAPEQS